MSRAKEILSNEEEEKDDTFGKMAESLGGMMETFDKMEDPKDDSTFTVDKDERFSKMRESMKSARDNLKDLNENPPKKKK